MPSHMDAHVRSAHTHGYTHTYTHTARAHTHTHTHPLRAAADTSNPRKCITSASGTLASELVVKHTCAANSCARRVSRVMRVGFR